MAPDQNEVAVGDPASRRLTSAAVGDCLIHTEPTAGLQGDRRPPGYRARYDGPGPLRGRCQPQPDVAAARRPAAGPVQRVATDQLLRFAGVGVVSTLGYLFLFIAWRPLMGPLGANALAMAPSPQSSTPRCTGSFPAALTTLGLVLAKWVARSAKLPELVAITVANLVAAVFRFAVLRAWIFRPGTGAGADPMEKSP
jgi:putative flippase GtrA